jgi:hypothetical protein
MGIVLKSHLLGTYNNGVLVLIMFSKMMVSCFTDTLCISKFPNWSTCLCTNAGFRNVIPTDSPLPLSHKLLAEKCLCIRIREGTTMNFETWFELVIEHKIIFNEIVSDIYSKYRKKLGKFYLFSYRQFVIKVETAHNDLLLNTSILKVSTVEPILGEPMMSLSVKS